jgi:integrase/recombinase XerD
MNTPGRLTSSLAEPIVRFIAFKRMQGYEYKAGADEIGRFDTFLTQSGYTSRTLRIDILERYAEDIAERSHSTRAGRLATLRQFSVYLHALRPESVLLPSRLVPQQPQSIRFYPLSSGQVGELMAATATLKPDKGVRVECMRFLIGLLYSTGLRISEALGLNLADMDTVNSTLFVRRGKFRKERLVPLSPSALDAVNRWLACRAGYAGNEPCAPLFVSGWNRRLSRDRASRIFRRLCIYCGMDADPPARLHDLRHNYACACITRWRQAHEDLDALLPVLANAMGHANFHDTEIYIHIDAAALQQAGETFRQHYREHQR